MQEVTIDDPQGYFHELGDLHDARVEHIAWNPLEHTVTIAVDNLRSACADSDYTAPLPANIVLRGVKYLFMQVDPCDNYHDVYDIVVERDPSFLNIKLNLAPGGVVDVRCNLIVVKYR